MKIYSHDSIPFTRSIDFKCFYDECSKSAVKWPQFSPSSGDDWLQFRCARWATCPGFGNGENR